MVRLLFFVRLYCHETDAAVIGTGSTSMLPLEQGGVVDPTLKVYGTENVFVADAGIIPLVRPLTFFSHVWH